MLACCNSGPDKQTIHVHAANGCSASQSCIMMSDQQVDILARSMTAMQLCLTACWCTHSAYFDACIEHNWIQLCKCIQSQQPHDDFSTAHCHTQVQHNQSRCQCHEAAFALARLHAGSMNCTCIMRKHCAYALPTDLALDVLLLSWCCTYRIGTKHNYQH